MSNFCVRPANENDSPKINNLIAKANLDSSDLKWERFVVVETVNGVLVGCGQVKDHEDGSSELASIAVEANYRGQGIGRLIINTLLSKSARPLFLICRLKLRKFYQKFGFVQSTWDQVSPYYHQVRWIFALDWAIHLFTTRDHLIIMRLE